MTLSVSSPSTTLERLCPYCRSELDGEPVPCPDCGTAYHGECADVFLRCAIRGCPGRLSDPDEIRALPKLPAFAARLDRWETAPDAELAPHAVLLLPNDWETRGADESAALIGELMGQTALDGRVRLAARHVELLLRTGPARAAEAIAQLERAGLAAASLPLVELARPLEVFTARSHRRVSGGRIFADGEGRSRTLRAGAPCFAILAVEFTRRRRQAGGVSLKARSAQPVSVQNRRTVAWLYEPRDPSPIRLEAGRVEGLERLEDELAAMGAEVETLAGARQESLLTRVAGGDRYSNRAAVSFMARLLFLLWRRRLGEDVWRARSGSAKGIKDGAKTTGESKPG